VFGRADAQNAVRALLDQAASSRAATLTIRGEPGMGKTILCAAAEQLAEKEGFTTVWCSGVQFESGFPMATLAQMLRPLLQREPDLAPQPQAVLDALVAGEPIGPIDPYAVGTAALSALAAVAEHAPVLVVIDDAQWVDALSGATISFVVRRLYAAVLLASRTGETTPFPKDWPQHDLAPLQPDHIRKFVASLRPDLPPLLPPVTNALRDRAGGNPLAVREAAHFLTPAHCVGDVPLPDPLPLGERGAISFGTQVQALNPRSRTAVAVVAAAGTQPALIPGALTELGMDIGDLDEAVEKGLLTAAPAYAFTHPLRRSAAYESVPEATRRSIHRILAALNKTADVERYAYHLNRSGADADELAAAIEQAALSLSARAGAGAAAPAWARAAELTVATYDRRRRALQAAVSFLAAGEIPACQQWLGEVLGYPPGTVTPPAPPVPDELTAHARLVACEATAMHTMTEGELGALSIEADELATTDPGAAALALSLLAGAHLARGGLTNAATATHKALAISRSLPEGQQVAAELWAAHTITLAQGARVATPIRSLINDEDLAAFTAANPMTVRLVAQTAYWQEDYEYAAKAATLAVTSLRADSTISWLPYALAVEAETFWHRGIWERARADITEALQLARQAQQYGLLGYVLALAGRIAATSGRDREAVEYLEEALTVATGYDLRPVEMYARCGFGANDLTQGRPKDAVEHLSRAHTLAVEGGLGQPNVVPYNAMFIEALAHAGHAAEAAAALRQFEADADRSGSMWAAGTALRCRAVLHPTDPDSEAHLRRSVDMFTDQVSLPFERHQSQLELGMLLRRQRRLSEARRVLGAASGGFRALGAAPWTERCDLERRAAGERDIAPHAAATGRLSDLTAQQLQVVLNIAGGATNRQAAAALFISAKTVDYHLQHSYDILGVRTRAELARLVASQAP
jgi:DNA-binding CsgD family transcriptional regulator/tetratricopeptide (TPR) repeat protein